MFRHNARLRKLRPSSPPVFGRGGEKPPPLPKWEGRREASSSPPPLHAGPLPRGPLPCAGLLRLGILTAPAENGRGGGGLSPPLPSKKPPWDQDPIERGSKTCSATSLK